MKRFIITGLISVFFFFKLSYGINTDSLKNIAKTQTGIEKAASLNMLSEAMLNSNPQYSLEIARQAYKISKGKNYENEIMAISNLTEAYLRVRKYDSSDMFVEKGLELSLKNNDTIRQMSFYTNIGWTYFYQGNFNDALTSFTNAMDLFEVFTKEHPDHPEINIMNYAKLLNNKATIYTKQGYYDTAIILFKESLEYRQKHNAGPKHIAPTLLNIGSVCYKNGNYSLAEQYFNDALLSYKEINDTLNMAICYNNLGHTFKKNNDTISAINSYEKSISYSKKSKNNRNTITALNSLSSLYINRDIEKSFAYSNQALKLNDKKRYKSALSISYHNLATCYLRINNIDKSIELAQKSLKIMKQIGQRDSYENVYDILSQAYEIKGNFQMSLHYHKLFKTVHDSIFNAQSRENYNKLQLQLETAQKEKRIALLKKENEKKELESTLLKNRQMAILIISVILIVLLAVVAFSIYSRQKKDKFIHRQKELVHKKEKDLAKAELEKSKLKEEELQQSVLFKSKQLSTHALHMMQKNTMLQEIQKSIKELAKKAPVDDKPDYKNITNQIKMSLHSDKDWDVFKLYFEEVNRDFYNKLKSINPELTTNDHRLCALIKLNMTSKEMASVLNVAPNSIKSSRYRLKKKLGLEVDDNLEEYIRNL